MKNFLTIVRSKVVLLIVSSLMTCGLSSIVNAMAERPPDEFYCDSGTLQPNPGWTLTRCEASPDTDMVPDDASWPYPSGWIAQTNPQGPLKLRFKFDGWGYFPPNGINASFAAPGEVVIKSVYSHYPTEYWIPAGGGFLPVDMGGPYHGVNTNGNRFDATISAIAARGYQIDWGGGIALGGNCYGGSAAITQSLILPKWQPLVSHVDAMLPGMNADCPNGWACSGKTTWPPYDITLAQHSKHLDKLQNIRYRIKAASYPKDNIGFNPNFGKEVCDAGHISCFITWGDQGHAWPDPEAPPAYQAVMDQYYAGPYENWRLDTMKVVFTHSTANYFGLRGHYNLGLTYDLVRPGWVDSRKKVLVPIRYLRQTNMGVGIPDQPLAATFNLHLRPMRMRLKVGNTLRWQVGSQSGVVTVKKAGEVSIRNIALSSSPDYTMLSLTK